MLEFIKIGINFFILSLVLVIVGCSNKTDNGYYETYGNTMGTTYSIKIIAEESVTRDDLFDGLQGKIDSILGVVNQQMSTYIDTSEISLFNKQRSLEWFEVSSDLAFVFSKAIEVSNKSDGAFDITIGPLVNLWGFGPVLKVYDVPDKKEIEKVKEVVGFKNIAVSNDPPMLKKNLPDIYCDLSAIAKGYGVDKVAGLIESFGFKNYLVEIGGEVRTRGVNQEGNLWKIGISTPDNNSGIEKIISLKNASMATSGDYRNYFEKEGVRYSHTIDSRTGYPIAHKLASVTVIHDSCVVADAFATAIDVLGPEEGLNLALREKLPVFLIIRKEDKFIEKMTPEFQDLLKLK